MRNQAHTFYWAKLVVVWPRREEEDTSWIHRSGRISDGLGLGWRIDLLALENRLLDAFFCLIILL